MKILFRFTTILILFISFSLSAQDYYGIVFPNNNRDQVCRAFSQRFRNKPKEVKFSVQREGVKLYFTTNDKTWFNNLFQDKTDGLAIDVISKSRYDCDKPSIEKTQIKGQLLQPVYKNQLLRGLKPYGEGSFRTLVGELSSAALNQSLEYNILFLFQNQLCRYQSIYNLESYPWDILDMGMYLDSLTYNNKEIKPETGEGYLIKNKTLNFTIPFEKNKSEYTQADIKPIYDSLKLTDFNIKAINIKAYSSVEGSLERNIELQQQRANSIVEALQSFQKPTITTEVSSSENWVEFLNDIKTTSHTDLVSLSKKQIKSQLVDGLSLELEPILKYHRKAVLKLELERIDKYKDMSADELLSKYKTAFGNNDVEEAKDIQNSIFDKIKTKVISSDFLQKMEVPKQVKFADLINKNSAFKYMLDARQSMIVFNELKALEKIVPKDSKVKYNKLSVKIKLWHYRALEVNPSTLKNEIQALKNYNIPEPLIKRMLVNFNIITAENAMQQREYNKKDVAVKYINNNYKRFELSNFDYLSLAQFFSYYANTDYAVDLLEEKVRRINVDEDLLFYYLNLTLVNNALTSESNYRSILLNAYNMNPERFCKLFNSLETGGVTFQLLENEYLRKTYCENCEL